MNETPARYGNAIHIPDHRERNKAAMACVRAAKAMLPATKKAVDVKFVKYVLDDIYSFLQFGRKADL